MQINTVSSYVISLEMHSPGELTLKSIPKLLQQFNNGTDLLHWRMLLSPIFTGLVSYIIIASRPAACPPLAVLLDSNTSIWMGKKRCSATLGICTKTVPLMCRTWGCLLIPSDCHLLKYKLSAHCAESLLFLVNRLKISGTEYSTSPQ